MNDLSPQNLVRIANVDDITNLTQADANALLQAWEQPVPAEFNAAKLAVRAFVGVNWYWGEEEEEEEENEKAGYGNGMNTS